MLEMNFTISRRVGAKFPGRQPSRNFQVIDEQLNRFGSWHILLINY